MMPKKKKKEAMGFCDQCGFYGVMTVDDKSFMFCDKCREPKVPKFVYGQYSR